MELIHADADRKEIGYLYDFDKLDAIISQSPDAKLEDNSFSLIVGDEIWAASPIHCGHYIYVPGTEWGGQVETIRHNTARKQVTLSGLTWRGALYRKIIAPPDGQNYLILKPQDANAAISSLIGNQLGDAYKCDTSISGVQSVRAEFRYINLMHGLHKLLLQSGAALHIEYNQAQRAAVFSARPIVDYSSRVDLSQDYGVDMVTIAGGIDRFNHVIALGAGELEDRDILHVYRLDDGTLTMQRPAWHGTAKDHVMTYNYTNPEDIDKLREGAEKILIDHTPLKSIEIDPRVEDMQLNIGDIVGARDKLTGMIATARITGKVLTMDDRGIKIETRVG